jgi:parvulin-like peptidyl-prolyl isomerase
MNTQHKTAILSLLFLIFGAVATFSQVLDRPVALVELHETANIGQRQLRQRIEAIEGQFGASLSAEERREVLDLLINEELVNQAAEEANIRVTEAAVDAEVALQRQGLGVQVTDQQFQLLIEQQTGLSFQAYREEIRQQLIQRTYIQQQEAEMFQNVPQPSDREIRAIYNENATQFTNPAMVRFEHLFVDTRNLERSEISEARSTLEQMRSRIRGGSVTFTRLMRESVDDPAYSGVDFGYLLRTDAQTVNRLGEDFVDAVFELEEDEVSGVLESNIALHIVRVTDNRAPRILELDDPLLPGQSTTVRGQIRSYLIQQRQAQVFQEATRMVVEDLRERAEIELFEENLEF